MCTPTNSLLQIRVVEHDIRVLTAEFEGDVFQVGLGCCLHDLTTDEGGACERDLYACLRLVATKTVVISEIHLVDFHMLSDSGTDGGSVPCDDVNNSRREPDLLDQGADPQGSEWRELGRLEHNRVACCESGSDLPCEHEKGEVP